MTTLNGNATPSNSYLPLMTISDALSRNVSKAIISTASMPNTQVLITSYCLVFPKESYVPPELIG